VRMTLIQLSDALAGRRGPRGTSCAAPLRPLADFTLGAIRLFWA